MKLLVIFAVIAAASARVAPPKCHVSAWGEWSDWNAPNHDNSIKSFPVTEKYTDGSKRALMMSMMQEQADIFTKCMSEGTCPQYDNHQIDGPAQCIGGVARTATADYPCSNVDMSSFVPTSELFPNPLIGGGKETNDIWGWTDTGFNGDDYIIVGMNDGASFVRVTDAENPVVLGHLVTNAGSVVTTWRDIKVYGDYAFIVSEHNDHGMQVFDLKRLRTLDGSDPERFTADAVYSDTGNTHNIVGSLNGYMYLVGSTDASYPNNCRGGLHVIDVRDPVNPTFAGCFGDDAYVHDAQCLSYNGPDAAYVGREICFCYNEDTLTIVDVEDKSNMVQLSRTGYGGSAYSHQGWLSADQSVLLLDDELDEQNDNDKRQRTYIWDVSSLTNPTLENTYYSELDSIDHNMYIFGDLVYQANYRTGLRILRLEGAPAFALTEVASFDNYPDADGAIFNGAWSNYRFAPDKVAITSSEYGVYMLRPNVVAIEAKIAELDKQKTLVRTRSRDILEADDVTFCPALVETQTM